MFPLGHGMLNFRAMVEAPLARLYPGPEAATGIAAELLRRD